MERAQNPSRLVVALSKAVLVLAGLFLVGVAVILVVLDCNRGLSAGDRVITLLFSAAWIGIIAGFVTGAATAFKGGYWTLPERSGTGR